VKNLRYGAEALVLYAAFAFFRLFSPVAASNIGGWIGRTIGPRLAASRKAINNLQNAFPGMDSHETQKIVIGMWDNLGRVMAEYPHLKKITLNHLEIIGENHLHTIGKENPCVIFGGHLANWELLPFYFNYRLDWPVSGVYRAPNNPYVEKLLDRARNPEQKGAYIPKSKKGTREMVETLRSGERVLILIDQKYNEGIPANFFGRPAMTSTAFAQLARKYDCPIVPLQIERVKECDFRLTIHPPFAAENDDAATVLKAHGMLEGWIGQHPGQWLWLHRRWDSKALQ
jgi:Kdo2-lipid IVA lauroyltransferase/acyltransferase